MTEPLELFEIRAVLEQLAATKAVQNINADDARALEQVVSEIDALFMTKPFDVALFTQLNSRFHGLIYARSGRPLLTAQIRDRRGQVQHYLHRYMHAIHEGRLLNDEHHLLLSLLLSGRSELAGQAMFQHIMGTGEDIARVMEEAEELAIQDVPQPKVG